MDLHEARRAVLPFAENLIRALTSGVCEVFANQPLHNFEIIALQALEIANQFTFAVISAILFSSVVIRL